MRRRCQRLCKEMPASVQCRAYSQLLPAYNWSKVWSDCAKKDGIDKQEIGQWIRSMPRLFIAQSPERVIPKAARRLDGDATRAVTTAGRFISNHVMLDAICSICHYKLDCFPS